MLTVAGLPLGSIDGHERTCELEPADGLLCECVCPGFLPVRFFFNENFLIDPPEKVNLYYTKSGLGVYVRGFVREDPTLRPILQERLAHSLVTLYTQGGVQCSVENETGFHLIDLSLSYEHAKAYEAGGNILLETPTEFCILSREGAILTRSEGTVTERGQRVTAEVPFHDSLRHTALCTFEHGKLTECRIRTGAKPTETTYALALFESVLIGADPAPYLAENLQEKADALGEFLGKFVSVVLTERTDEVGLVCERKPRVYDVRYFRVTLSDGKISNITPVE